jgi:hypothetical protein
MQAASAPERPLAEVPGPPVTAADQVDAPAPRLERTTQPPERTPQQNVTRAPAAVEHPQAPEAIRAQPPVQPFAERAKPSASARVPVPDREPREAARILRAPVEAKWPEAIAPRLEPPATLAASAERSPAAPSPTPAARLEQVIEPPAPRPASLANDIRVRIPDQKGGTTDVRFVENRGEVRVSVRATDEGLAETLRGDLNDLAHRLSNEGIRAELWRPGSDSAFSQHGSPNSRQDSNEFSSGGNGSGSRSRDRREQEESNSQNRPKWLEEMDRFSSAPNR